jgi:hypothetical protein
MAQQQQRKPDKTYPPEYTDALDSAGVAAFRASLKPKDVVLVLFRLAKSRTEWTEWTGRVVQAPATLTEPALLAYDQAERDVGFDFPQDLATYEYGKASAITKSHVPRTKAEPPAHVSSKMVPKKLPTVESDDDDEEVEGETSTLSLPLDASSAKVLLDPKEMCLFIHGGSTDEVRDHRAAEIRANLQTRFLSQLTAANASRQRQARELFDEVCSAVRSIRQNPRFAFETNYLKLMQGKCVALDLLRKEDSGEIGPEAVSAVRTSLRDADIPDFYQTALTNALTSAKVKHILGGGKGAAQGPGRGNKKKGKGKRDVKEEKPSSN